MAVQEIPWLLLTFVAGAALAAIHFTGLWLTVKRLPGAKRPGALALLSHFGRLVLTLAGFVVVAWGGHWLRIVAALVGFVVCRAALTHILGPRMS
ncbi:MAG: ATP synthase subunit I [Actinobacteria bacterium]|nr:ATP synthase subunit I [Actinomycetota bacterium]